MRRAFEWRSQRPALCGSSGRFSSRVIPISHCNAKACRDVKSSATSSRKRPGWIAAEGLAWLTKRIQWVVASIQFNLWSLLGLAWLTFDYFLAARRHLLSSKCGCWHNWLQPWIALRLLTQRTTCRESLPNHQGLQASQVGYKLDAVLPKDRSSAQKIKQAARCLDSRTSERPSILHRRSLVLFLRRNLCRCRQKAITSWLILHCRFLSAAVSTTHASASVRKTWLFHLLFCLSGKFSCSTKWIRTFVAAMALSQIRSLYMQACLYRLRMRARAALLRPS